MQQSGGQHPGEAQPGVQQSLPAQPPSTRGASIGPATTPGVATTPGETTVPGGSGVEAVPKLVPGEVPGVERSGGDKAPCDAGDDVAGCRHEYGTSGYCGVVRTGAGMGRGALPVLGPTGIGWATGKVLGGLKAKVLPPLGENKPVG
jgi:hypothetical protein